LSGGSTRTGEPLIRFSGVDLSFSGRKILEGIDLEIKRG